MVGILPKHVRSLELGRDRSTLSWNSLQAALGAATHIRVQSGRFDVEALDCMCTAPAIRLRQASRGSVGGCGGGGRTRKPQKKVRWVSKGLPNMQRRVCDNHIAECIGRRGIDKGLRRQRAEGLAGRAQAREAVHTHTHSSWRVRAPDGSAPPTLRGSTRPRQADGGARRQSRLRHRGQHRGRVQGRWRRGRARRRRNDRGATSRHAIDDSLDRARSSCRPGSFHRRVGAHVMIRCVRLCAGVLNANAHL